MSEPARELAELADVDRLELVDDPPRPPRRIPAAPAWWDEEWKAGLVLVVANVLGWALFIGAGYGFLELARWCARALP